MFYNNLVTKFHWSEQRGSHTFPKKGKHCLIKTRIALLGHVA